MEPVERVDPAGTAGPSAARPRKAPRRKTMVGRVASNKMDKTVVVKVEKLKTHPLYHRNLRRVVSYKAHDEQNACSVGDLVRIVETRPLSREKRWRVVEIVKRGEEMGAV